MEYFMSTVYYDAIEDLWVYFTMQLGQKKTQLQQMFMTLNFGQNLVVFFHFMLSEF